MKIAIHPDKTGSESYSQKWAEFLSKRKIEVKWVDLTSHDALEQLRQCDGLMWRTLHTPDDKQIAKRVLFIIERYLNIPVFPDFETYWHYDDKIAQNYMFQVNNVPTPKTWVFWSKNSVLNWLKSVKYPQIFKLSVGASSSNVIEVTSEKEAHKLINKMFDRGVFPMTMNWYKSKKIPRNLYQLKSTLSRIKQGFQYMLTALYPSLPYSWWHPEKNYIYFQEFIPDNLFDTRITIIGDRAFGYRRFNRPKDFRASGSGKFDVDPTKIDPQCVKIAFDVSKRLKFQSMAYDFIFQEDNPVMTEISYTFVDWMVRECPGHWNSDLNWIEGCMWPEEAQVEDFIKCIKESKN